MAKRILTLIIVLAVFVLCEPLLPRVSFAIPNLYLPKDNSQPIDAVYTPTPDFHPTTPQKSHAPEPATLFMILSGLGAMLVRFARRSFERFKRWTDIGLSLAGILITSPLLVFAAMWIKLSSPGPIIYRQIRVGKGGKRFKIYKLRTMRIDAEKYTGAVWAKANDPRITPVGRILRKTHIDEIPQLLNVLKGEMSIVGPRPERPEMVRDFKNLIVDYEKRLLVKPGITGLAQVWHKYDETLEDVKQKVKYDLLYIRRMCLLTDLRILANTFIVVLTGRGAR
ncbi:MAG: sugar transferase [Candidatus Omnitrophota bacterium]